MYFIQFQVLGPQNIICRQKFKDNFFNNFFILLWVVWLSISFDYQTSYFLSSEILAKCVFKFQVTFLIFLFLFKNKNRSTKHVQTINEKNNWILVATLLGSLFILCVIIMLSIYFRKSKSVYCIEYCYRNKIFLLRCDKFNN